MSLSVDPKDIVITFLIHFLKVTRSEHSIDMNEGRGKGKVAKKRYVKTEKYWESKMLQLLCTTVGLFFFFF